MAYNPDLKEWRGSPKKPLYNLEVSVGDIVFNGLALHQDRIAERYVGEEGHSTFGDIKLRSTRVALNLKRIGIGEGDVVSIMCYNHKYMSSILYGCSYIGAPFSTLHLEYEKEDLVARFKIVKPKLFICDESRRALVKEALTELGLSTRILTFEGVGEDGVDILLKSVPGEEFFVPTLQIKDAQKTVLCYLYTSGTTGTPKAVRLSHAHLNSSIFGDSPVQPPGSVTLFYCSVSWISMVNLLFSIPIFRRSLLLVSEKISFERLAAEVQKHNVTEFFALPINTTRFVNYLMEKDIYLKSIQFCMHGGYTLFQDAQKILQKHMPNAVVFAGYGMTELFAVAKNFRQKPGAVGDIVPRKTVKVVDFKDNKRLGPNETGEICVKCDVKILGYVSEEANKEAFDSEGFFHTGDVGYVDEEGTIYINGRSKDLIKHKGVNFSASAVEDFIVSATGIKECCIVALDDAARGDELPTAAIVKPKSCTLTENDIVKLVADKFPEHKHLDGGVYFVDELSYSNTGKVQRHEVRKILQKYLGNPKPKSSQKSGQTYLIRGLTIST